MTRYKNMARLEQEEKELEELEAAAKKSLGTEDNDDEPVEPEKPLNAEEETFKKRYGDLRRFAQKKQEEYEERIKALETQVAESTKKQVQFPKTEEEFNQWASKYPDVVANIKTMIMKHNQEMSTEVEEKLKKIKDLETQYARDKALAELDRLHPDFFSEIRLDEKFHQWVEEQPKWIRDALYENETDAKAAARAIDLYKADMDIKKDNERPKPSKKEAAESVVTKTNSSGPAVDTGKFTFSESQVAKMSSREYEQNEEAIMEAIRSGKFNYDINGAAR